MNPDETAGWLIHPHTSLMPIIPLHLLTLKNKNVKLNCTRESHVWDLAPLYFIQQMNVVNEKLWVLFNRQGVKSKTKCMPCNWIVQSVLTAAVFPLTHLMNWQTEYLRCCRKGQDVYLHAATLGDLLLMNDITYWLRSSQLLMLKKTTEITTIHPALFVQHISECVMGRSFKWLLMLTVSEAVNKFNQS